MSATHIWIELFDLTGSDRQAWRSWYDQELLKPRSQQPGVRLVRRGSGLADRLTPTASSEGMEVAVYEVADPSLFEAWADQDLGDVDPALVPVFQAGSRRSYSQLSSTLEPYEPPAAEILHGGFFEVPARHHAEFNAWYEEEHIAEQLRVPGYLSVRRFQGDPETDRFVALYDVTTFAATYSAAAAAALTSPRGDRVRTALVTSRARRLFRVDRLEWGSGVEGRRRGR
jgi:hypothetical protein